MPTIVDKLKHIAMSGGVAAGILFLQTAETDGVTHFGQEPWWPLVGAGITLLIGELQALRKSQDS